MSMAEVIDFQEARDERAASSPSDGRLPPHDLEAEASVLAAIILGGLEYLARVRDFLRPEHFFLEMHRQLYIACLDLATAGSPIDTTTLSSRLRQQDRLAQVGGMPAITELLNATPQPANIVPHARIVHDRWRERQLAWTAQRIAARAYLGIEDTQEYCDSAVRSLSSIARMSITARAESNVDAIKRILDTIATRSQSTTKVPLGISTGLEAYDDEWGGLHGGEVTTIVARPKVGKTSLAIQMLATVTAQKLGVLMFSQDSSRDDLHVDLLSHVGKIDSKSLLRAIRGQGKLTDDEWSRLATASSELGTRTFWIDDSRKIHVGQVRARALATADEWLKTQRVPLGLVIVDYIQQLAPAPSFEGKRKHEYIGHAASEIKTLARAMKVPILVMAQQKRDAQGKAVWEASDCSEIEKECDNLFFIQKLGEDRRRLRCSMTRRGARRDIDLAFEGASRTFSDAKFEAASRQYARAGNAPPPGFYDDGDDS